VDEIPGRPKKGANLKEDPMRDEDLRIVQLKGLRDWADFIFESLTLDRRQEAGRVRQLEELVGEGGMRELRQLAFTLRDRFHTLIAEAEYRSPVRADSEVRLISSLLSERSGSFDETKKVVPSR
jgi:hypothetical protein